MKRKIIKLLLCLILIISITGCKRKIVEENLETPKEEQQEKISTRKEKIINLVKEKMINENYIDESNLKSFDITRVYIHGYYKEEENKKNIEITFKYQCNTTNSTCLKIGNETNTLWITMNEEETEIYQIMSGISITREEVESEKYIQRGEIIE